MAFTGGIKRPQASTSNNNNTQQNYYDRLVTIVSYNTESRKMINKKNMKSLLIQKNILEQKKVLKTYLLTEQQLGWVTALTSKWKKIIQ